MKGTLKENHLLEAGQSETLAAHAAVCTGIVLLLPEFGNCTPKQSPSISYDPRKSPTMSNRGSLAPLGRDASHAS